MTSHVGDEKMSLVTSVTNIDRKSLESLIRESDSLVANSYASSCFKKAGIDFKHDDSLDYWHKIKWSFRKPRFYNGSPLIEVCFNIAFIICNI